MVIARTRSSVNRHAHVTMCDKRNEVCVGCASALRVSAVVKQGKAPALVGVGIPVEIKRLQADADLCSAITPNFSKKILFRALARSSNVEYLRTSV